MRADKAKVVDEIWDEARIESFLNKGPMGDEPEQFSCLLNAYRGMRSEDFARFLEQFKARGGDANAQSKDGRTLLEIIEAHELFAPVRKAVVLNANQTPIYSDIRLAGHDGGDFIFAPK